MFIVGLIYILTFPIIWVFNHLAYKICRGSYKFLLKTKYYKIGFVIWCVNIMIGSDFCRYFIFRDHLFTNTTIQFLSYFISLVIGSIFALIMRYYYTHKIKMKFKN